MRTRITEMLGIEHPIVQAPMGFIARAQLASAVSNAGGLGIIESSSGLLDEVRDEIVKMRDLTDKPFGVNVAQLFVRDNSIVDFVAENGVTFVTTSAGDPTKYTQALKDAGITVFHVVPSLRGALKAVDAGVDGLVVEGNEGGGFKAPTGASTMVLLPLIASRVDVPIIAAGGICDGRSMAAALVLGAEGVQMGTRMVSAAESPVHDNWKNLICSSNEGDTLLLNRNSPPAFRVLRTEFSESAEREARAVIPKLESVHDLYFGGNLEASFAFSGQVAGRITEVLPVKQILEDTIAECDAVLQETANRFRGLTEMGDPVLRDATAHDSDAIAALHADSWRRNYRGAFPDAYLDGDVSADRQEVWTERLGRPSANAFTIVAEIDGDVAGFAHTILDEDAQLGALVDNLHVTHAHKREGIGARLMAETARRVAARRPESGLYLDVLEQNAAAQAFYAARGGAPTGPARSEPVEGGGSARCFTYAWTVSTLDRLTLG